MKYCGQDCQARPFADDGGSGTEWYIPGADGDVDFVACREYATRVVPSDEAEASARLLEAIAAAKL